MFNEVMGSSTPECIVTMSKLDNGYVVQLQRHPKPVEAAGIDPFGGMEPDEAIDKMVDTLGAFLRTIHDKGAGEDWKNDSDRALIREGFKSIFPQLVARTRMVNPLDGLPRYESKVFESKDALMEYLKSNV